MADQAAIAALNYLLKPYTTPRVSTRKLLKPRSGEVLAAVTTIGDSAIVAYRGIGSWTGVRMITLKCQGKFWELEAHHDDTKRADKPKPTRNEYWHNTLPEGTYMDGAWREGTTLWPDRGRVI